MSDILVLRTIDAAGEREVFDSWSRPRRWVRTVLTCDRWESRELEINRRNARKFMRGKHKIELAELILGIMTRGGQVVHVMHRDDKRIEADLGTWATRVIKSG